MDTIDTIDTVLVYLGLLDVQSWGYLNGLASACRRWRGVLPAALSLTIRGVFIVPVSCPLRPPRFFRSVRKTRSTGTFCRGGLVIISLRLQSQGGYVLGRVRMPARAGEGVTENTAYFVSTDA